jgi:hypothetical protein
MIIHDYPNSWYVNKLKAGDYFSTGRYGDGSWNAVFGNQVGRANAEGSIYTTEMCHDLRELLKYNSPTYYFSTPAALEKISAASRAGRQMSYAQLIVEYTQKEFVEGDTCWDGECRLGGLVPFIRQIQEMPLCIISNRHLRGLTFLKYKHFIEISYPNCYSEIDSVIRQAKAIGGNGCVYLVSAGQAAPVITQKIHSMFSEVFALDVGSIWDAFVRIGAQRGWRGEFFADPIRYSEWLEQYREVLGDWKLNPQLGAV